MEDIDQNKDAEESSYVAETSVLDNLNIQLEEYKDKYLRALADYQNLKKRSDNEYSNGFKNGQDNLIEEFIPFIDDFERMIDYELDYKGVMLVYDSLKNILDHNNIVVINPDDGDQFQEQLHNAIIVVPTIHKELDNCVKDVISKGYKHNGNIVRYANVSVYKYQEEQNNESLKISLYKAIGCFTSILFEFFGLKNL